ncbi:MAG: hypothetical protein HY553_18110 [Elusimicrobia bacterium]|nr:hypothetical protein [Elusimicrobiota bacterium]
MIGLLAFLAGPTQAAPVSFDDLGPPISISVEDWKQLARSAGERLRGWKLSRLPKAFANDVAPRVVFLSVSTGATARVVYARGQGVAEAIDRAAAQLEPRPDGWRWLKVDVVQTAKPPPGPAAFDPSVEGTVTEKGALLPEQLSARGIADAAPKIVFRSSAVFLSDAGLYPVFRGHRHAAPITQADAHAAVNASAAYLRRAVGADGRLLYAYDPVRGVTTDSYSLARHAGSVLPLLELKEGKPDAESLAAVRRALAWLVRRAQACPRGEGLCLVDGGTVSTGANALAVIALARTLRLSPDPALNETMKRLGQWLLDAQTPLGDFHHKVESTGGNVRPFRSPFYSGQALLALVELHLADRDPRWLDAADRALTFLRDGRDRKLNRAALLHDHWLLQGLDALQRVRPRPENVAYALRLADAIVSGQNDAPTDPQDWKGGWGRPPRSVPAATRSIGLCSAYRLARDFEAREHAPRIRASLERALSFQLQTQFGPESAMYLKDPQRVVGAFRRSLDVWEVRTDYQQHNLAGLLCWLRNR